MSDDLTPPNFDFENVLAANTSTGDPVLDELTWERLGVDLNHPAGDVPMPGEQPTEPSAPLPPKGSIAGPKVSVGTRGMTDAGIKRAKGVFGEADARIAARAGELETEKDAQIAKSREHYTAVGEAFDLAIEKTREFQQREQELQQQVIAFNQQAAELEQRMAAQAQAERAAYLAEYKEQLALVKQLALQSGNPMGQLSRAEAIGLAGAQFAQGFLAAQGVNIDVAGQVDRWVERSIAEHQMKIQNARASAEDQLHLYEIARQNSQDEWEARQRYRGFVIAGLQAAIHLNASRFQSDIAIARATEQIARLQVEADATERAIGDAHLNRLNQIYQSEYDRAYKMGQLSIEQRRLAIEKAKAEWEKDPRNPKNQAKNNELVPVYDVEPIRDANGQLVLGQDGKPQYRLLGHVRRDDKDAMSKIREARSYTEAVLRALDDLEDKRRKAYAAYGGAPISNTLAAAKSPEIREYLRARKGVIMTIRQATTGKAFTKEETKEYEAMIPNEFAWQFGNNDTAIQQVRERLRTDFESKTNSYLEEGAGTMVAPRIAYESFATFHGKEPEPGIDEKLLARITARDSESIERQIEEVSGAWADFKQIDHAGLKKASESAREYARTLGQPEWGVALETLAYAVAAPRRMYKQAEARGVKVRGKAGEVVNEDTPAEIRLDAYNAISRIARGEGGDVPVEAIRWANYLKDQIDNDPVLSAALEYDRDQSNAQTLEYGQDVLDSPFVERLRARPGRN